MNGQNAKRSPDVTDEMWDEVSNFNRDMVNEYLENQAELSKKTKVTYESCLKIFFYWVKEHLGNKNCIEIKKKEFVKYLNWLSNRGLSESAIKTKKSSVSAFCNYIMMMYEEEYPTFRSFVTSEMKVPKTGLVYEKKPLNPEEYQMLYDELKRREQWQKIAYLSFTYSTGCRREESRQLLKEVCDYKPQEKEITVIDEDGKEIPATAKYYLTHTIRCKGASIVGKPRKLKFGENVMDDLKKWLEVRGEDDCPYMFIARHKDKNGNMIVKQISESTFNLWCKGEFANIVGRRVHPHLMRESRATNIVVYEHKSAEVAQKLLGHNDVSTTKNHYIINENEIDESDEAFI